MLEKDQSQLGKTDAFPVVVIFGYDSTSECGVVSHPQRSFARET
jgi:hypothetical protein